MLYHFLLTVEFLPGEVLDQLLLATGGVSIFHMIYFGQLALVRDNPVDKSPRLVGENFTFAVYVLGR